MRTFAATSILLAGALSINAMPAPAATGSMANAFSDAEPILITRSADGAIEKRDDLPACCDFELTDKVDDIWVIPATTPNGDFICAGYAKNWMCENKMTDVDASNAALAMADQVLKTGVLSSSTVGVWTANYLALDSGPFSSDGIGFLGTWENWMKDMSLNASEPTYMRFWYGYQRANLDDLMHAQVITLDSC